MGVSIGKWTKHNLMAREEGLSMYLPHTKLLTENSLWKMMDQYEKVMIKPCIGYHGRGIVQITSLADEKLEIHSGYQKDYKRTFSNCVQSSRTAAFEPLPLSTLSSADWAAEDANKSAATVINILAIAPPLNFSRPQPSRLVLPPTGRT